MFRLVRCSQLWRFRPRAGSDGTKATFPWPSAWWRPRSARSSSSATAATSSACSRGPRRGSPEKRLRNSDARKWFCAWDMTQGGQSRLANRRGGTPFNPVSSMALIVQKYGGTSVGDIDRIKNVAQRIKKSRDEGHSLVVVVSARSGVTNELIAKAKAITDRPDTREMDMLLAIGEQETIALTAMALHAIDIPAVSYTGAQAGIFTDPIFTKAKIQRIIPKNIQKDLKDGKVIIVAGFQGINEEGQITTLGRGGSDLTAIALAAALKADKCEIYTDVDGVYTADPRVVKDAQKLEEISYDEMLELASLGSKVMQSRSVEFAKKYGVVFEVRSSFNHNPGTIVKEEVAYMEKVVVRGVAVDKDQAKVVITGLPDKPSA